MDNKLQTLGLAYRASKVILGEQILDNINNIKLLFIANDISEKSNERYLKKCSYYAIDYIDEFSTQELSNALGKNNVKVVGIIDEGFKKTILKK